MKCELVSVMPLHFQLLIALHFAVIQSRYKHVIIINITIIMNFITAILGFVSSVALFLRILETVKKNFKM